tara:strand:+ start:478 stop:753 length:276 start_codon:yes stop_codon:yes gene_type:complete
MIKKQLKEHAMLKEKKINSNEHIAYPKIAETDKKSVKLIGYVHPDCKKYVTQLAKENSRKISAQLNLILIEHFNKNDDFFRIYEKTVRNND